MSSLIKKLTAVLFLGVTIASLYCMSLGIVGTFVSYLLIIFTMGKVIIEVIASKKLCEKLKLSEKIKEEIPRKVAHMLPCLVIFPMIHFSFSGTKHIFIVAIGIALIGVMLSKTGFFNKIISRNENYGVKANNSTLCFVGMVGGFIINSIIGVIFPQYIIPTALGFTALGLGDPMACFIGKKFGKHRFSNGKSVEGVLGFIIGATIAMYIISHVTIWKLLIIATVGAIVELYSENYDNLCIQLAVAFVGAHII